MAQVGERSYPLASRTTIVVWLSIAVRAGLVLAGPGCRRNMLLAVAAFFIGRTEKAYTHQTLCRPMNNHQSVYDGAWLLCS